MNTPFHFRQLLLQNKEKENLRRVAGIASPANISCRNANISEIAHSASDSWLVKRKPASFLNSSLNNR